MLAMSPKGTVPVLITDDGIVIDQSLDIMRWALGQNDSLGWLSRAESAEHQEWILCNDTTFKYWLDRYKYAERYPEFPQHYYRDQAQSCLIDRLERHLSKHSFLGGDKAALSDVAIFPFIRQFAAVDSAWFETNPCVYTRNWLKYWLECDLFKQIMEKRPVTPEPSGKSR
jgi:glutathione S-transferase